MSISEVSQGADQTGSASSQALASMKLLAEEINTLKSSVDEFFKRVRSA